jgi:flagellar hook assembly protein FlgD
MVRSIDTAGHRTSLTRLIATLLGVFMVVTSQAALGAPSAAAQDGTPDPLAVFIVGPSAGLTDDNKRDSAALARDAEDAGMRVRKVFHPNATWENVLDAIQGASLVVYMGHGNGWPSPHGPFQEDTKDGFGLNPSEGGSAYSTNYYGADKIRKRVRLAPNAVVLLGHLCYASGNGEEYMGPEHDRDVATKRADNYASGFLDVGARAVFAYGMDQKLDFPRALMRGNRTMDEIFKAPNSDGRYDGFVGTRDYYRESKRTGWARLHMDPHPRHGHYRAVTGDLSMTASEFRAGAGELYRGGGGSSDEDTRPPVLKVPGSSGGIASVASAVRFSPNGDGAGDRLRVRRSLNEKATIRVVVRDRKDEVVRVFSRPARRGTGTVTWDGRDSTGRIVRDGTYSMSLTPTDKAGNKGATRTIGAAVLTTVKSTRQRRKALYAADRDRYARSSRVAFTLVRRARVSWVIRDSEGRIVETHLERKALGKGRHAWSWDGRGRKGRYVKSGTYRMVITARTSAGTVRITRPIHVGAFRIVTSDTSPKRGQRIRIRVYSAEPLKSAPRIRISQPGVRDRIVSTRRDGTAYVVTVRLRTGGKRGDLRIRAVGVDKGGERQDTTRTLRVH